MLRSFLNLSLKASGKLLIAQPELGDWFHSSENFTGSDLESAPSLGLNWVNFSVYVILHNEAILKKVH